MAQIPHADEGRNCPFNGQDCSTVCHKCPMWVQVRGTNPNTGAEMDRWDCSFALMPLLMIENSQQQRQTGAAVESFRNQVGRQQAALIGGARIVAQERIPIMNGPRLIEIEGASE